MVFNKGSELDKQIYPEGESTWGCKSGVLDVEDVKEFIEERMRAFADALCLRNSTEEKIRKAIIKEIKITEEKTGMVANK